VEHVNWRAHKKYSFTGVNGRRHPSRVSPLRFLIWKGRPPKTYRGAPLAERILPREACKDGSYRAFSHSTSQL